jgi:hypothetical protein
VRQVRHLIHLYQVRLLHLLDLLDQWVLLDQLGQLRLRHQPLPCRLSFQLSQHLLVDQQDLLRLSRQLPL